MYVKKGYPENGELVVCTVTRVEQHSAFASLDEYESKEGMIHASELQRKWVRNIKTMLKEGRKLVCRVIGVDERAGHINLSVKRVGASQDRNKMQEWKNEQKANDILEQFAKSQKMKPGEAYKQIGDKILEEYGLMHPTLLDISKNGESVLVDAGVDEKLAKAFADLVKTRVVVPKASVEGEIELTSSASDGVDQVKSVLKQLADVCEKSNSELKLHYLGAPKYKFNLITDDYKAAEKVYAELTAAAEKLINKSECTIVFKRKK